MSKLFNFLENFDPSVIVHIVDKDHNEIWPECKAGDIPLKISSKCSVVKEKAINHENVLVVIVEKHS